MAPHQTNNWKHLAEQASKEMDPEKLMILVEQLNTRLGEEDLKSREHKSQSRPCRSFWIAV